MSIRRLPIISKVLNETNQTHEVRLPLLQEIEKKFNKKVVVFYTSFFYDNGYISDEDASMIEEILLSSNIRDNLLLIINSAGGSGLAAERIVEVCRRYCKKGFDVLVPHMAKSAATMICFGANNIFMGETCELGPVDDPTPKNCTLYKLSFLVYDLSPKTRPPPSLGFQAF